MSFSPYGDPNSGKVATRPACWGSKYDSESRECRGCGWQNSCREHIIQLNLSRPTQQPAVQVTPGAPAQALAQYPSFAPAPYTAPVPVVQQAPAWPPPPPQQQAPQVQQFRPPPPPAPAPVQQQAQYQHAPFIPPPAVGGYGSIGDQMFNVIGAIPAPVRPQYQGESFGARVVKNSLLSGVEAMVGQVLLGIRQFRWYPQPKPPEQVVEVQNQTTPR